jgi:hypothetical protein
VQGIVVKFCRDRRCGKKTKQTNKNKTWDEREGKEEGSEGGEGRNEEKGNKKGGDKEGSKLREK